MVRSPIENRDLTSRETPQQDFTPKKVARTLWCV